MIGAYRRENVLAYFNHDRLSTYKFLQENVEIILGSCPRGYYNFHREDIKASTDHMSMNMNFDFFNHYLREFEGIVILIAECCGQYNKNQIGQLKRWFPKITWIAPDIPDFADNFSWERVFDAFLEEGLIVEVKESDYAFLHSV